MIYNSRRLRAQGYVPDQEFTLTPNGLEEQEPAVLEELLLLFRQLVEASDGLVGEP